MTELLSLVEDCNKGGFMKKLLLALTLILLTFSFAQAETLLGTFNLGANIIEFQSPVGYSVELIWRGKVDENRSIVEIITPENNPYIKPGYNTIFRSNYRARYIVPIGAYTFELNTIGNQVQVWVD
jgi:hypothetical protein